MSKQFLLENVSVDTVGTPIFGDGAAKSLIITGNFGAGDVTIEVSDDGTNFVALTENGGNDVVFTSPTSRLILSVPSTQLLRATLANSAGASAVTVTVS